MLRGSWPCLGLECAVWSFGLMKETTHWASQRAATGWSFIVAWAREQSQGETRSWLACRRERERERDWHTRCCLVYEAQTGIKVLHCEKYVSLFETYSGYFNKYTERQIGSFLLYSPVSWHFQHTPP